MATPPGRKLSKLCRTAIAPGALRVPLHEPIKLAEGSSSARLARDNLDPANAHASARSTPDAANPRIPRVHIFIASEAAPEIDDGKKRLPPSRKYIFDLLGLRKYFERELFSSRMHATPCLRFCSGAGTSRFLSLKSQISNLRFQIFNFRSLGQLLDPAV
jgi:hypothetical protein